MLIGVMSHAVDDVWTTAKPLLQKAVDYADGKYSTDDVYNAIKNQDMQLWLASKKGVIMGAAVTQIIIYPQSKRFTFVFLSGYELDDWIHFGHEIFRWARNMGCEAVEIYGRDGWRKKLKHFGFEKIHTVLRMAL